MQKWYVYLVLCQDNSLYCGITTDLERRLKEHNGLISGGAKYTRHRRPVQLHTFAICKNRQNAARLEEKIKRTPRAKKIKILQSYIEEEFMNNITVEINTWLETWQSDPLGGKQAFLEYYAWLQKQPDIILDFKQRPGVSYSLRAKHISQSKQPLFVMIDVVDDEPDARWLSICFYAQMVSDPEELGDFVPQGLLGEDALCLNLEEDDANMRGYILQRIQEATKASKE